MDILKSISFKPVDSSDYALLHQWYSQLDSNPYWLFDKHIYSTSEFVKKIDRQISNSIFFTMVQLDNSTQKIGFVYTYNESLSDGYCYICVFIRPEYLNRGTGFTVGALLCSYLFKRFNFRKIYSEVLSFNKASLNLCKNNFFEFEAKLTEFKYYDSQYWDLHILSLTRQNYHLKLLPKIKSKGLNLENPILNRVEES